MTSGIYGQPSITSSASASLQRSLENKLRAKTQILGSTLYTMTWKPWVTPSGRSRFRLRASVRRTSETGCTGWPTPSRANGDGGQTMAHCSATGRKPDGTKSQVTLNGIASLAGWPTPTTSDSTGAESLEAKAARGGGRIYVARSADDAEFPGPTNGYWRAADWLGCRDEKFRPVEPGTFPLADGVAARVGRLRGYGNAINAEAAKAFIEAVM